MVLWFNQPHVILYGLITVEQIFFCSVSICQHPQMLQTTLTHTMFKKKKIKIWSHMSIWLRHLLYSTVKSLKFPQLETAKTLNCVAASYFWGYHHKMGTFTISKNFCYWHYLHINQHYFFFFCKGKKKTNILKVLWYQLILIYNLCLQSVHDYRNKQ